MKSPYGRVPALEVVQIVLIILKLYKLVPTSWAWVLSPTWSVVLLYVIVVVYEQVSSYRNDRYDR